jgi:hypothetical protein
MRNEAERSHGVSSIKLLLATIFFYWEWKKRLDRMGNFQIRRDLNARERAVPWASLFDIPMATNDYVG